VGGNYKNTDTTDFHRSFPDEEMLERVSLRAASDRHSGSRDRIERNATRNERLRLARELHDGVLQSLTGAALQLEAVKRLLDNDPRTARQVLREIQELIVEEQRELRASIEDMKEATADSMASHDELAAALHKLCGRISRWGPRVLLRGPDGGAIPRVFGEHVYRLVEESLNNVTRHARATIARVEVNILEERVTIVVEDDGSGFPFRGRYDLAQLNARRQGPVSLKERVASLDGDLVLISATSGSRLEFSLPVPRQSAAPAESTWRRRA
jgi:signal transduction histidine kinase